MDKKRVHLLINGSVQGVFFRATAQQKAQELGVYGWVRNNSDGSVEVLAEGPDESLKRMVDWCNIGPSEALVRNVSENWQTATGEFKEFRIEYI